MTEHGYWSELNKRRIGRRPLIAGAAGMSLLAACGSRKSPSGAAAPSQAGKPKYGGQFNIRVSVDPIDFDPSYNGKTAPGDLAMGQGNATLMSFKTGRDVAYGDMVLVPKLAERWEVSPDGTSFIFHLR